MEGKASGDSGGEAGVVMRRLVANRIRKGFL